MPVAAQGSVPVQGELTLLGTSVLVCLHLGACTSSFFTTRHQPPSPGQLVQFRHLPCQALFSRGLLAGELLVQLLVHLQGLPLLLSLLLQGMQLCKNQGRWLPP